MVISCSRFGFLAGLFGGKTTTVEQPRKTVFSFQIHSSLEKNQEVHSRSSSTSVLSLQMMSITASCILVYRFQGLCTACGVLVGESVHGTTLALNVSRETFEHFGLLCYKSGHLFGHEVCTYHTLTHVLLSAISSVHGLLNKLETSPTKRHLRRTIISSRKPHGLLPYGRIAEGSLVVGESRHTDYLLCMHTAVVHTLHDNHPSRGLPGIGNRKQ